MRAQFEKVPSDGSRSFRVEERRLPRFDAPWHFHPEIELTLIVASRGRRFVGDSIERFAEGDLVLLGPSLPHFWHNDALRRGAAPAHSIVVQFRSDFLGPELWERPEFSEVRRLLARAARGLHFSGSAAGAARERIRALPVRQGVAAVTAFLEILDLLSRARAVRALASAGYAPDLDRRSEDRLARVYGFLMRRFTDAITLAEIARVAAMSPASFSRYFKRVTGRNVSEFINELRIDHAARLLSETDWSVGRIAAAAGFPTLSNFNRRFRQCLRCTPREYRRALAASWARADRAPAAGRPPFGRHRP